MVGQNRTDLVAQPALEANAPEHGSKAANERAMQAMPMPRPMAASTRQTNRPSEPVQAGLPIGPGASSTPLPDRSDAVIARLQGLLRVTRDPELSILVGNLQRARRMGR